jgi:outer membrane receptor for ferrienterochelin and colicin
MLIVLSLINNILVFFKHQKLKKYLLIYTILLLAFNNLFAQTTRTLKGNIKDKKTAESLIGASVMIKGTNTGTSTDFDGNFTLKTDKELPLILVINYMGYIKLDYTVTSIEKPLAIKLEQNVTELKEAEIRDSRITEKQKQNPITVETMDATAIKQTPAANFYEGLAHLKGVDLTSASIGFKIINTRGFNSTSPVRSLQLIDGVDNQSPGLNFSLGNFLGASELDVQKVDLIVGASSAYYGPNAFNGAINMQTKSPFLYKGLSASIKVGERSLFEGAVRWAQVFKDKKGDDRYAYKLNFFYMRAYDWEATNYNPTSQSPVGKDNAGGYDAVNRYGDENSSNFFYTSLSNYNNVGYGYYLREGYAEKDLVDYNTRNIKLNTAVHYKITKDIEAIYASSFSTGTTVYQGDNRFSLKDILFFQNRVEVRKENKFFIRAYATNEDAGKSFDAYNTALIMQNNAKSDKAWGEDYGNALSPLSNYVTAWRSRNLNNGLMLSNIPTANNQRLNFVENYWRTVLADSLLYFHQLARAKATGQPSTNTANFARFEPGSYQFDTSYQNVTTKTNTQGGSRLFDKSALYHIAGEYKFTWKSTDFTTGGNFRYYAPHSNGSIFSDTGSVVIRNREVGGYIGAEKKFFNNNLKLSVTNRLDKNQNFKLLWSPAATAVYVYKKQIFRFTASSAIRNPTLSDQYILLDVGRATLKGNLNGFDSLVTTSSFLDALNNGRDKLVYFNVAPIQPEEVKTIEFGYRGTLLKDKFYYDLNYYHSWYTNFIGYKIGIDQKWQAGGLPEVRDIYRVAANAADRVTTQGITVGLQYFYKKYLGFSANYSWNKLDRNGSTDPLIPAFNTPEHKYNLGVNGREFDIELAGVTSRFWSYGVNYKYQTGFMFEGSPQFTGQVDAYDMVDAQISKKIPAWKCVFKLGASNLLNNKVYQVYGGPQVGRMAYFSIVFELDTWK